MLYLRMRRATSRIIPAEYSQPSAVRARFRSLYDWCFDRQNWSLGDFVARIPKLPDPLKKRAAQTELLLMDVDGTMTDGGVTLLSQTKDVALEIKTFDALDRQGLTLPHAAGLRTGCITGRKSSALLRRAREMNMEFIYMKQALKMPAYQEIVRKAGVSDSVVAYVGDDLPDLPSCAASASR